MATNGASRHEAWKEGREAPVNGTDLKNWPGVTPAQLKTCQNATIRTVEDLAEANADSIGKLGMGGVSMMEKAKAYLKSANINKTSEQITALTVKVDDLTESIKKKDSQISELIEQLDEQPKKRGKNRKEA
mgnify:FL=1